MRRMSCIDSGSWRRRSMASLVALFVLGVTLATASQVAATEEDEESNSLRIAVAQIPVTRDVSKNVKTTKTLLRRS